MPSDTVTKSVFSEEYRLLLSLLVQARKERDITQRELGSRLGRDQSFVSKFERGVRRLDVVEFMQVASAIDVDPFDLLRQIQGRARDSKQGRS
ncbi:MAG TPA: helix-turn-helix transcriptional regulator [Longimicrobiales bacterium]